MLDIEKLRRETPGAKYVTHFDNAGAALPCHDTVQVVTNYINKEARTGGYAMQFANEASFQKFYSNAAQLINCRPDEISLTIGASDAQAKILYSFPFKRGDVVVTTEIEYSNNFMNLLNLKKQKGIKIRVIKNEKDCSFDLEKFENAIDDKVKLIAATHIPTSSGQIAPVEAIGKIAKKYKIPYLLDACQSIGHCPVDVQKIGCDFATATSRKYLRGPRGLGFLFVKKSAMQMLTPPTVESWFATWQSKTAYEVERTNKMFEGFEKPYSNIVGLATAIDYQNQLGIEATWERIQMLSKLLRLKLNSLKSVKIVDPKVNLSGIVTFVKKGVDCEKIHQNLAAQKINVSVTRPFSSLIDMKKRKLNEAIRASVHYYNTKEEIDKLVEAIDSIK